MEWTTYIHLCRPKFIDLLVIGVYIIDPLSVLLILWGEEARDAENVNNFRLKDVENKDSQSD